MASRMLRLLAEPLPTHPVAFEGVTPSGELVVEAKDATVALLETDDAGLVADGSMLGVNARGAPSQATPSHSRPGRSSMLACHVPATRLERDSMPDLHFRRNRLNDWWSA